jgi:hypothetical protein
MSLFIPELLPYPRVPRAKYKDVLCCLLSSATAAERGSHREDSGLEEKSVQAICSRSQLNSQRALVLPEALVKLQDIGSQRCLNKVRVGRAFGGGLLLLQLKGIDFTICLC